MNNYYYEFKFENEDKIIQYAPSIKSAYKLIKHSTLYRESKIISVYHADKYGKVHFGLNLINQLDK